MAQPDILFTLGVEGDGQVENKLSGLAKKVTGIFAAVKVGQFIGDFVKDSIKLAAEMETMTMQFEQFTGSAKAAEDALKWTKDFAAKTPFEFPELVQSQRLLLAFGRSVQQTQIDIRRLGDLSAGTGSKIGELAYLFGTARTQGVLMTKDIREFAGRGIPIIEALAKTMGILETDVFKFAEKGKIGFAQLETAIASMTEGTGDFKGLMDKLSQSTEGQLATLRDNWNEIKRTIGEGLLPVVKELVSVMNELLTDPAGLKEMRKSLDLKLWDRFFSGNREKFREFAKATGASNAELSRFIETLGDLQFNGQSTADVMLQLFERWKVFKNGILDANKVIGPGSGAVGLIGRLQEKLKSLDSQLISAETVDELARITNEIKAINREILNLQTNADPSKLLAKQLAGMESILTRKTPEIPISLNRETLSEMLGRGTDFVKEMETRTEAVSAFRKSIVEMQNDLMTASIMMAGDFAANMGHAFGLMITGADGVADAFRNLVNDLLVQIPKMVGMALINTAAMNIAAITSGASLPMLAAGLALVGLSGLISGIIQGRDEPRGSVGSAADVAELPQRVIRRGLGGFEPERPEIPVIVNTYPVVNVRQEFDTNRFLRYVIEQNERKGI